jgi:hypothetical protein
MQRQEDDSSVDNEAEPQEIEEITQHVEKR